MPIPSPSRAAISLRTRANAPGAARSPRGRYAGGLMPGLFHRMNVWLITSRRQREDMQNFCSQFASN